MKNNRLVLPELFTAEFSEPLPETRLLLLLSGRAPNADWLTECLASYRLWCADGGINLCKSSQLVPERLIGDGDSASPEAWAWAKEQNIIMQQYPSDKDLTDLQLALQIMGQTCGPAAVVLTGAWGGRFDHTFSNVMSLIWSREWGIYPVAVADEQEVMVFLNGPAAITIKEWQRLPNVISLMALDGMCTGVSISGVRWPLDNVTLTQHQPYAISNRLGTGDFTVKVKSGWLGVYFTFEQKPSGLVIT
ncbi:thiamine diphosphokinase [Sporomusa sp.]|uniref:thiamine diphosphokinase n=1 Tax=Sporomusa sp. TaxID=2078658 RepID=UPI002C89C880|nr:thiamine diphosphokinase [Sporomusa sp.]HWR44498.1 thiamine diphosphokinase [Sporomusa sp.]